MLIKYTVISSSLYDERQELIEHSVTKARQTKIDGWDKLENDHQQAWANIWKEMDVVIEGDPEAQQGVRYNIFQLCQTYRGKDSLVKNTVETHTGIRNFVVYRSSYSLLRGRL